MLWVPQKGLVQNVAALSVVTTGAVASTKGAVIELITSLPFDAYWVTLYAKAYSASVTASQGSFDLMVGAAGVEVVKIADLLMGYAAARAAKRWDFPLYLPAGTRLSARAAGARVSSTVRIGIRLSGGNGYPPYRVGQKVTTYGMGTVPNGTTIVPGASGAEGSWTQITAATSENHFALVPSFQVSGDTTINNRDLLLDVGLGAAAAEQPIGENFGYSTTTTEDMSGPHDAYPCFQDIPSGTRLAMRVSNDGANDGGYDGVLHAIS